MWSWPCPGDSFVCEKKTEIETQKKMCISDNFSLLKIKVNHVDQLILNKPIHTRKRWILRDVWIEERINP